ncbi:MAG: ribosome maturation factor RimM [Actinomycetales bacterium]|nr:ribosome maturation factor RimM [Actinomycetales bacterium]
MRVVVGRIGRPHGIRGEVTVEPRTDEPEDRFAPGAVLAADGPVGELVVHRAQWHSGRLLVRFEGIDDRNRAEELRGVLLSIERDPDEEPDDPDEYYDSALEGCRVVLPDGTDVGEVVEVVHLPGQDLLSVRLPDERDVLVPFVEAIVPTVDATARRVVITPPPGLFDVQES